MDDHSIDQSMGANSGCVNDFFNSIQSTKTQHSGKRGKIKTDAKLGDMDIFSMDKMIKNKFKKRKIDTNTEFFTRLEMQ